MKKALFGGTFDPIHQSHIAMARQLADALALDEVIFMPTFVPPHKIKDTMASAEDRLAMCRLAVEGHPRLTVSSLEIERGGASFTVDTLRTLCADEPDAEWYLLTGADMFCTLRTWYHFNEIAQMVTLCTVPREGTDMAALEQYADELTAAGARCYVAPMPVVPISSTAVRQRLALGESVDGLLPIAVADYIRAHGLYTVKPSSNDRNEQYKAIIRARLGDYRYHHSLCVADEAARLARLYGADEKKAYTAGLLHDILKDTDAKSQLQMFKDFAILLDEVEMQVKKLWHARAGAAFLEHILGIDDREILEAVRYHTTGRAGMGLLEKVVFVADFTSADRDYPDVDAVRRLSDVSLEDTMVYAVAYTIHDLLNRGQTVHPNTVALYNELILAQQMGGQTHER